MMVDDEDTVRKRVINNIDFSEFGMELVCEAENGSEAYEMFLAHEPDVVITDIKMPFMDGLELSEKILNDYPYTKIIILTGFDEFEFAKKSIEIHIMKYILKPVSMKELVKILRDTKEKIDEEIDERRSLERLKEHYDQSFPLMRQKFLEGLIQGEYTDETINKWLLYYHVPIEGNMFNVSVVQIDGFYADKIVKRSSEIELRKIALLDMVNEISRRYEIGAYFLYNDYVVIINSMETKDEQEFLQRTISTMDKLRQGIGRFLDFTVTIGIGYVIKDKTQMKSSYKSAMNAQDYKLALGQNQVIYINDMEPNNMMSLDFSDLEESTIKRLLKTGSKEKYTTYINKLFEKMVVNIQKSDDMRIYILELVTTHMKTAKETGCAINTNDEGTDLNEILEHIENINFVKSTILINGYKIIEGVSSTRVDSSKSLAAEAMKYVKLNYTNWELNVESISAYLHYSPNYFSSVFKKETGIAFMKYLLDIRLEKAKELLQTTNMKNFEIAVEIGFSSANYFSFCFKKELGISPSQFKKTNK